MDGTCIVWGVFPTLLAERLMGLLNFLMYLTLPLCIMCFAYICIVLQIKRHNQISPETSNVERQRKIKMNKENVNVVKTFILLSVCVM